MFAQIKTYYQTLIPELTNESWSKVEEKFTFQYLKKGELLTRNGEVCKQVSFINRGLLRMFYLVDGKEICTAFAKEADYLAQYDSFLTKQPSPGNIDALEGEMEVRQQEKHK